MTPDVGEDLARVRRELMAIARRMVAQAPTQQAAAAVEDALRYDLALLKALRRTAA